MGCQTVTRSQRLRLIAFAKTILFTYKLPRVVGIKSLESNEKAHDAVF